MQTLLWVGLLFLFAWSMFSSAQDRYVGRWADECHSKGGAAVYVYTDAVFSKRINCLDAKRVDMKDNEP